MGIQQKYQKTLIGLFKHITKSEHRSNLEHEINLLEKVAQNKYLICNA
jgi:hypothetical protein